MQIDTRVKRVYWMWVIGTGRWGFNVLVLSKGEIGKQRSLFDSLFGLNVRRLFRRGGFFVMKEFARLV